MVNEAIKQLLEKINEESKKYGIDIFNENKKAGNAEVAIFNKWALEKYNIEFPEYVEFVKYINGLHYNGAHVFSLNSSSEYSIYNFYNFNSVTDKRKRQKCLLFASDDLSWYWLNTSDKKYYVYHHNGKKLDYRYETFEEIMVKILKIALRIEKHH